MSDREGYPLVLAVVGSRTDPDGPYSMTHPLVLETGLWVDVLSTNEVVLAFSEVNGALEMIEAIRVGLVDANAQWSPDHSQSTRFIIDGVDIDTDEWSGELPS